MSATVYPKGTRRFLISMCALAVLTGSIVSLAGAASVVSRTPRVAAADATWSASTAVTTGLNPVPASAATHGVHPTTVACATPTTCVIVGTYDYADGESQQGLIEMGTMSGGSWIWKAETAPTAGLSSAVLPGTGAPNGEVGLSGVSCGSPTSCVAVGSYGSGTSAVPSTQALIETGTLTGDTWKWVPSSLPAASLRPAPLTVPGSSGGSVGLGSIACTGEICVAIGSYDVAPTTAENVVVQPLIWSNASGTWKQDSIATSSLTPATAADDPIALTALSCATPASCVIAGSYYSASTGQFGVIVQGNPIDGTWTASNAVAPTSPDSGYRFTGVSCPSLTSCVVSGSTFSGADILETGTLKGSMWRWTNESLPTKQDFNTGSSISCPSVAYCVIVGRGYNVAGETYSAQFVTGSLEEGKWDWSASNIPLSGLSPPADPGRSIPSLTGVTCKVTTCLAVGQYANASGVFSGLVEASTVSGGSSVTGSIEYDYAAGAGFVRGTPFTGESQKTPARDTEVQILASTKSECSTDVLSSTYTSDTGLYTSAPITASQHYFCVKILASTPYSQVVRFSDTNATSARQGTLSKDDAYASEVLGPKELNSSGDTTVSWKATGVTNDFDQALDIDNAVVTGARWVDLYGLTPKFTNILYPYPSANGVSNFNSATSVGAINPDDAFDWGVLLHEYGHFVADLLHIDNTTHVTNNRHSYEINMTDHESTKAEGLAISWDEGFADFFSQMVQRAMGASALGLKDVGGSPPIYIDEIANDTLALPLDVPGDTKPYESLGEDNELAVARVLWAFYDRAAFSGGSGSVAFMKILAGALTTNSQRDLSGAVDALLASQHAQPWVPDVGRSATDVDVPVHYDEATAVTTYGRILSSQRVAPTITSSSMDASGSSIMVKWTTGQPQDAKDALNFFVVQFWNSSYDKLLTEQIVASRTFPLEYVAGSLVFDTSQVVPKSWKSSSVNIVVLGWNTHEAPKGLTESGLSNLTKGLDPLTGPYVSAPATVSVG